MALDFDGSTQYVDCGNDSSLNVTTGITQTAWIYPTANVAEGTIATKRLSYYFQRNNDGRLASYQYGTTPEIYHYSSGTVSLNTWSFVAYTYDGSYIRFYINGALSGETAKTGNISTSAYNLRIGNIDYIPSPRYFDGQIFDNRIYNRGLTPNEIAEIYHRRGADRVWQGLVGWWRLDELTSGTPAPLLLDAMDATAGWNVSLSDSISLNTTTYQEGSGAINFIKGTTVRTYSWMFKTVSSVNVTGQTIKLWIYIKDQTTLNKIRSVYVRLYSTYDTDAKSRGISNADLAVGWNLFSKHINDFDNMGTPDITAITTLRVQVNTNNASDTISNGSLIYDFYRAGDYVPNSIIDLSGNGNHGTPYGGTYQASPHRLRRGVLVS